MHTWEYFVLLAAAGIGIAAAYLLGNTHKRLVQFMLSFSGAYVLGVTVVHLLPEVYFGMAQTAGAFVLAGFFLQLLLENLSQGVEHGHVHAWHQDQMARMGLRVMLGLCIHALIEGLPLGGLDQLHQGHEHGSHHHHASHIQLLWGVALHKIPESFSLAYLLFISKLHKNIAFLLLTLFACMTPLGALLVSWWQPDTQVLQIMLALAVGSLLHVATTIIFEADNPQQHHLSTRKLVSIALGLGLALLTIL
jgi:zinc transporter ZupT